MRFRNSCLGHPGGGFRFLGRCRRVTCNVLGLLAVQLALAAELTDYNQPVGLPNIAQKLLSTRLVANDPSTWHPVTYQAVVPTGGVTLTESGLFKRAMENNITYLLNSFSVNHMLVPFRTRTGVQNPPDEKPQVPFWDTDLRGANAGRFMMGAGNTLRWIENPELRGRLDELIDGIESCRKPNGYILAHAPTFSTLRSEEPNYARSWFT